MELRENVSLADYTTLRLGGPARFFVSVSTVPELREAVAWAHTNGHPLFILGGGSNTLVTDYGWPGLVVHVSIKGRAYDEAIEGDAQLVAGAGEAWDAVVEETVNKFGLWGLENLSLIPGTVGATPVQNVGAYGVEVCDVIEWVEVLHSETSELSILSNSACEFGYRDSIFKRAEGKKLIVTRVAYRLSTHPKQKLTYRDLALRFPTEEGVTVQQVRQAVCEIRAGKFPNLDEVGTAGSFFKNPIITNEAYEAIRKFAPDLPSYSVDETHVKVPVAWMLDRLGYKGKRSGAFGCHDAQPLVLVHYGGGTPSGLILFAHEIMREVKETFAITLEPEVRIVSMENS